MDVAKMSIVMNQALVKQQANLAVMKKAMNTAELTGDALIDMLHESMKNIVPHPYLGNNIDMKI